MRIFSKFQAFTLLFVCLFLPGKAKNYTPNHVITAIEIAEKNISEHSNISQLIVVFNEKMESSSAVLVTLEKRKGIWIAKNDAIKVGIGKKGFALENEKIEGDQLSPTGLFKLGMLFTYLEKPATKMPFIKTTADDKWIDDPESEDYNTHVRGSTQAKSFERMKLRSDAYKYCMVIEYNTNPVVKAKGSAIFIHLNRWSEEATAGCVGLMENEMKEIIKWMNPKCNPHILMGNKNVLLKSLH